MAKIFPAYDFAEFQTQLLLRIAELIQETGEDDFIMPIGIFLLIDESHGGDSTAQEIAKRFELLNFESRNVIDFYFFGWLGPGRVSSDGNITTKFQFDSYAFDECRKALRAMGITRFGGNADLILVDAHYAAETITLNFPEAIRIDLSRSASEKDFPTLGGFLQAIIEAAEEVKRDAPKRHHGIVYSISDKLGVAVAKNSMLDFFLEKFGKIIGAKRLKSLAVRNLAPAAQIWDFR